MLERVLLALSLLTTSRWGTEQDATPATHQPQVPHPPPRVPPPEVSKPEPQVPRPPSGSNHAVWIKQVAGPPDEDHSSENEVPRPRIVTRVMTYRSKHVRVVLMPTISHHPNASTLPYQSWTIVAFVDPDLSTYARLSRREGFRRLLDK
jgi:hypothetical protein